MRQKSKHKRRSPKSVLRLPDLDHSKSSVLQILWSHAEKTIARRAFDKALAEELEALIREAKSRAARYDYRYSALPLVFAHLLRDGRLTEDDLNGLEQEKLDLIRRVATL
jgi:hypothetical protein